MYKYTYLLSQSYRSDTSCAAGNYQAGYIGRGRGLDGLQVNHKIMPSHAIMKRQDNSIKAGSSLKNIEPVYVQKVVDNTYGKEYKCKEINKREHPTFDTRKDKSISLARGSSEMKIKSIAEKYSHHQQPVLKIPPSVEKAYSTENNHHLISQPTGQENKAYRDYKEQKITVKVDKVIEQYQSTANPRINELNYSPINEIRIERQPLKQANGKFMQQVKEQQINRTRIRSQISSHLQRHKAQSQHAQFPLPKKYIYISQKETTQTPPPQREAQSSQTVAKLSSLQQRIKSTIGSYLPA